MEVFSATVSYTVPSRGRVTVSVYDTRGSRVATLIDNEERAAGAHRADWDGRRWTASRRTPRLTEDGWLLEAFA